MPIFRTVGQILFKGTRFGPKLFAVYQGLQRRWELKSLRPGGWYTIEPNHSEIRPFTMYTDGLWPEQRSKIQGAYEEKVTEELVNRANTSDIFWEIGSKYGYHTLMMAQLVEEVVAFEEAPGAIDKLQKAIDKNGYDNVGVVEGTVGQSVSLDNQPTPDLIIMDIEGWEQEVLESIETPLNSDATWIVELHEERAPTPRSSDLEKIEGIFEEFGYGTTVIDERRPGNFHLIASKSN